MSVELLLTKCRQIRLSALFDAPVENSETSRKAASCYVHLASAEKSLQSVKS